MNKYLVSFISSILILMFIISGITKVISFGKSESNRLSKKININKNFSQFLVFIGGVWEIISCIILSDLFYDYRIFNVWLVSFPGFLIIPLADAIPRYLVKMRKMFMFYLLLPA